MVDTDLCECCEEVEGDCPCIWLDINGCDCSPVECVSDCDCDDGDLQNELHADRDEDDDDPEGDDDQWA
jgi:hypothetical protein